MEHRRPYTDYDSGAPLACAVFPTVNRKSCGKKPYYIVFSRSSSRLCAMNWTWSVDHSVLPTSCICLLLSKEYQLQKLLEDWFKVCAFKFLDHSLCVNSLDHSLNVHPMEHTTTTSSILLSNEARSIYLISASGLYAFFFIWGTSSLFQDLIFLSRSCRMECQPQEWIKQLQFYLAVYGLGFHMASSMMPSLLHRIMPQVRHSYCFSRFYIIFFFLLWSQDYFLKF